MYNSASNYDNHADQKEDDDESLVIDSHKEETFKFEFNFEKIIYAFWKCEKFWIYIVLR